MSSDLKTAEAYLERGDYHQSLELLEPMAEIYPLTSRYGAEIRILIVTALVGLGEEEKAIAICKLLNNCKKPDIRQRAKQLISVLEAPSLERPENWSLHLPSFQVTELKQRRNNLGQSKSERNKSSPPPQTGPTKNLELGFTGLIIIILIGLTLLLSGCVQITTMISIPGPDRISIGWELENKNNNLLPWQSNFEDSLKHYKSKLHIERSSSNKQKIYSDILHSEEADLLLKETIRSASNISGVDMNAPELTLKEQNWLIGVNQDLSLMIDLTNLPEIPGLNLKVLINPVPSPNQINTSPISASIKNSSLNWVLQSGKMNYLEIHNWRWNALGVGAFLIITMLILTLFLQNIRLQLGFGYSELPP